MNIINLKGKKVKNTHLGRLKLHYPITIFFSTKNFCIDNEKILKEILKKNYGYAYIVRGFKYDEIMKLRKFILNYQFSE